MKKSKRDIKYEVKFAMTPFGRKIIRCEVSIEDTLKRNNVLKEFKDFREAFEWVNDFFKEKTFEYGKQ